MGEDRRSVEKTSFSEQLLECNGLREAGFDQWAFSPGMLFKAPGKWWGDRGTRARPHEGIDLCLYTDETGRPFALDESTRIPVMFDGEIIKIEEDFLGQSVYVAHAIDDGHGRRLWTIYGHTRPADHIQPGDRLSEKARVSLRISIFRWHGYPQTRPLKKSHGRLCPNRGSPFCSTLCMLWTVRIASWIQRFRSNLAG